MVAANIQEAFGGPVDEAGCPGADLAPECNGELANLATRVSEKLSHVVPDVLLLQEAIGQSAHDVGIFFEEQYGAELFDYEVVKVTQFSGAVVPCESGAANGDCADPDGDPTTETRGDARVTRETAIVINAHTMMKRSVPEALRDARFKGGWIRSYYAAKEAAGPGNKPEGKFGGRVFRDHATTGLVEKASGITLAATSLHFVTPGKLRDHNTKRIEWVAQIDRYLDRYYPQMDARIISGDFNGKRCLLVRPEKAGCQTRKWWEELHRERSYRDAVFVRHARDPELAEHYTGTGENVRIDFIWTTSRVCDAGTDLGYDTNEPDQFDPDFQRRHPLFISSHRFLYANITLFPRPVAAASCEQ